MHQRSAAQRSRSSVLASCVAVILMALPGAASATTMHAFSQAELTYVADLVAEGVVEASTPERMEGSEFLRTITDLRLVQVHKGTEVEGDVVTLSELGGAWNGEETTLASSAKYTPGERVLVFLERFSDGWRTVGMIQGAFTMVEERTSGRDILVKVDRPYDLPAFDEGEVKLPPPASRLYADQYVGRMVEDLSTGLVPTYESIPGLPAAKDRVFKKQALAQGQWVDPRYFAAGELQELVTELQEGR